MHDVEDQGIFAIAESSDPRAKIDVDKENAIRQAQPVNIRHGVSIAPRTCTSKRRAHGQKSTDRGYPLAVSDARLSKVTFGNQQASELKANADE
jgi:hypothetical protein